MGKDTEEQLSLLETKKKTQKEINILEEEYRKLVDEETELLKEDTESTRTRLKHVQEQKKNLKEQIKIKQDLIDKDKKINEYENNIFHFILQQNEGLRDQETSLQRNLKLYNEIGTQLFNTVKHGIKYNEYVNELDVSKLDPKEAHKTVVDMERTAAKLGMRAGKGQQGVKDLTQAFKDLQAKTGATAKDAKNIVEELSQTGYVKNINEASAAISYFTRATGESISATTNLMNEFTKVGKFSDRESTAMLANIAKVQQKNGITVKGMSALTSGIAKATTNMKSFGQSDQAIKNMVLSTANLVSGMEKVGVAAEVAVGWVDKLTDPEKIEENIGLYAQLGMSISDALSGNIDADQIGEGMKEFGQKIKEMGPIAGAQFAKAFGVSYKDAIKAADFEGPDVQEVEVDESLEALKEMKQATLDASAAMQENINMLSGQMQNLNKSLLVLGNRAQFLLSMAYSQVMKTLNKAAENSPIKQYFETSLAQIEIKYAEMKRSIDAEINTAQKELDKLKEKKQVKINSLAESGSNTAKDLIKANSGIETKQLDLKNAKEKLNSIDDSDTSAKTAAQEAVTQLEEALEALNNNAKTLEEKLKQENEEFKHAADDISSQIEEKERELSTALEKGAALDSEAQKAMKDLETTMKNTSPEMKRALEKEERNMNKAIAKGGDEAGAEIKADMKHGADEIGNESRSMAQKMKDAINSAGNNIRNKIKIGGRQAGNSVQQGATKGANTLGHTLSAEFNAGANKIRQAMKSGSSGIKGGGGAGWVGLALSVVTMAIPAVCNKLIPQFGQWLGKSKWGKLFGDLLGIDTSLVEALNENTDATLGNTDSNNQEAGGPAQIFRQDNGRVAVKSTGILTKKQETPITTTGSIINQQTQQQNTSINNITDKSTVVKTNDNSGVESRLDNQIMIEKENASYMQSISENMAKVADALTTNQNNVAQKREPEPVVFVDSNQQTGHTNR